MDEVLFELLETKGRGIGRIHLNRPHALNALTHQMILSITHALLEWALDDRVAFVLITGEGEKAFCAGGDILKVYEKQLRQDVDTHDFFWDEYRLNHLIAHYPKPYVALMQGYTMGGGVGVAMHGDVRVGAENFVFAMPETGIGFFPDVGGTYLLSRLPNGLAQYLGLTGARLSVNEAIDIGLLDYCVTDIDALVDDFKQQAWEGDRVSVLGRLKAQLTAVNQRSPSDKFFQTNQPMLAQFDVKVLSELHRLMRDADVVVPHGLDKKSPLSLCVTQQALMKARKYSFEQCMMMEYNLVRHFLAGVDFAEGVRALLKDKDKSPQWQYQQTHEIPKAHIDGYFEPIESPLTFHPVDQYSQAGSV